MGASESALSSSQGLADEITTVSERSRSVDPILEKLKSLQISRPILTSLPEEDSSLTDILVRKPSSSSSLHWYSCMTYPLSSCVSQALATGT
ncbi:hypothetical protein RCOM_0292350 [Ricinus communis]|uniref:Uncharacterized protein n=1 Tax=Ricinus communis TaxID=3988 RepID=B9SZV3_RICCO|nr:hypothetical protein RCOM_0292350 [Ricinus communis]